VVTARIATTRVSQKTMEDVQITYFSPMNCMVAQAPAARAPDLHRSETSMPPLETTYLEPVRLGLAKIPPAKALLVSPIGRE